MKTLITGSSGLIGSALVESLTAAGHQIVSLTRSTAGPGTAAIHWDPLADRLDPAELEGLDAVVHLAGENIASGRWTRRKKARIRHSRLDGTRLLSRALGGLSRPPRVMASASAVGYYGDRGQQQLDETSPPGSGFLADLCRDWEAATRPAAEAGIRVVLMRFGVVLAAEGGALARMLPAFRWGLGGRLGSGRQYVSWITLDDAVRAVDRLLGEETPAGPVNLVAPQPVDNRRLTRSLGRVLRRPAVLPVPALALRVMLGEMADELLLSSARAVPRRLLDWGFEFGDPELDAALDRLLGSPA